MVMLVWDGRVKSRGDAEVAEEGAKQMRELDDITGSIVDASLRIHRALGPGQLESVYEAVLARALQQRGFQVERQKAIRFQYDGMVFDEGFRADLLVESRVIVELKSVERLAPVHAKQLLTYLKLTNTPVGLLINLGAATLREGLHRIVNGLPSSASPRLRVNQRRAVAD
jgi:iron complex transport system substrate-binding protein